MRQSVDALSPPQPATGDCFSAAGKFIAQDHVVRFPKDFRLVHAKLARLRQDVTANHAWVEEGDQVHEVSNGRHLIVPKQVYYRDVGVVDVRTFAPLEAIRLMISHGHWGPWD